MVKTLHLITMRKLHKHALRHLILIGIFLVDRKAIEAFSHPPHALLLSAEKPESYRNFARMPTTSYLCREMPINSIFFSNKRVRSRRSMISKVLRAKDSSGEGPIERNINPANPIQGIARLVSLSVAANAQSLASQIDKPVWLHRGGPLAAEIYNKISENNVAGAIAQLRDWNTAKNLNGEVLLALWRLIPPEVATIDEVYLEVSENLEGEDASVAAQLAEMARCTPPP
jgi:hypothetical protein